MQALYSAIMALARSADDARKGGWLCGALGEGGNGPKCVNGLVTWNMTWPNFYNAAKEFQLDIEGNRIVIEGNRIVDLKEDFGKVTYIYATDLSEREKEAGRIAGIALIKTRPQEWDELVISDCETTNELPKTMRLFENPDACDDLVLLGDTLARINDVEDREGDQMLGPLSAAEWFERAFEVLIKELPDPLPMLTVQTILDSNIEVTV